MSTIHMIHGYLGAGKTTFAQQLETEINCVRFSPDEWIVTLYGHNPPAEKFAEYYDRVLQIIDQQWQRIVHCGIDVVLDFGFWRRESRDRIRQWAQEYDAGVMLYCVRCSEQLMRERCRARNQNLGGSLLIEDNTFEVLRSRFEPLSDDEPHTLIRTAP